MTREERYLILRDKFTNVSCSDTKLTILKKHYRILIDSDRRYDRIRNLSHLIRILEKRDVVSPDNIHCMRHIADVLENQDIIESINSFNNPVQTVRARPNDVRLESINDNNTGRGKQR